jgi:hypothetical protein
MAARRYIVILRGASGARFLESEEIRVPSDTPNGPVVITLRTRHADERFTSPVPRDLWVEVDGTTETSLNDAMAAYWTVAAKFLPLMGIATNAPIDDIDVTLAYDATEGETEHEFYQHPLPDEAGLPTVGRRVPAEQLQELVEAVVASPHNVRIQRACAFYREALRYLKPGQEVLFVAFLWMAVEALTKAALRAACAANGCDEDQLVLVWGLAPSRADDEVFKQGKRKLDGEVRRRYIFHDDAACLKAAVDASDGLEHAYRDFDTVRAFAAQAKQLGAAKHIRRAIFELVEMRPESIKFLTTGRYEKPRTNWPASSILRGTFVGPADKLAPTGERYPVFTWSGGGIHDIVLESDGTHTITPETVNVNVRNGDGVECRDTTLGIWGPENDPIETAPTAGEHSTITAADSAAGPDGA